MSQKKKTTKKPAMVSELAARGKAKPKKPSTSKVDGAATQAYRKMAQDKPEAAKAPSRNAGNQKSGESRTKSPFEAVCRYPVVRAARKHIERARGIAAVAAQFVQTAAQTVATEVATGWAERRKARA